MYIFEEHFLLFHLILCRMNFWWFNLFCFDSYLVFWSLWLFLTHCYTFMSHYSFNTESYIDIQINKGNKIFSCHPNLEFLPLQRLPPVLMLKTKQTPMKSKKVVYKRMKHFVFLFFLLYIYIYFFILMFFLSPFHFSLYLHRPLAFTLPFMTMHFIEKRTSESEKDNNNERKPCRKDRETSLSTNFRWHKKNFIADVDYWLYLLFPDKPRSLCGMQ